MYKRIFLLLLLLSGTGFCMEEPVSKKVKNVCDLPYDMFLEICRYVDNKDLYALWDTSLDMREGVKTFCKSCEVAKDKRPPLWIVYSRDEKEFAEIKELHASAAVFMLVRIPAGWRLSENDHAKLAQISKIDLSMVSIGETGLIKFFEACPNIVALNMKGRKEMTKAAWKALANCTKLSWLNLERTNLSDEVFYDNDILSLKDLKYLNAAHTKVYLIEVWGDCVCDKLEELILSSSKVTDFVLDKESGSMLCYASRCMNAIKERGNSSIYDAIEGVRRRFPNVTHDGLMALIFLSKDTLKRIDLSECRAIGNKLLFVILMLCKKLEWLDVSKTSVDDTGIELVMEYCPALLWLGMDGLKLSEETRLRVEEELAKRRRDAKNVLR